MNRRKLIELFGALAPSLILSKLSVGHVKSSNASNEEPSKSPHADALSLVLERQQEIILKAESEYFKGRDSRVIPNENEKYWLSDTNMRTWSVYRPYPAGDLDTTHSFYVSYAIEKKLICRWYVDTRKREIQWAK